MPCFHPRTAYLTEAGDVVFVERGKILQSILIPCRQCAGCRDDRAREWALRCTHEAKLYTENSFVTLTYSDQNLPRQGQLVKEHFQLFMKRLRKRFEPRTIRFYACGEYGTQTFRPHFHAILFNLDFADKYIWRNNRGHTLYRSSTLESIWTYGQCEIGNVTFASAKYVASYIKQKITGDLAKEYYKRVDPYTGEIYHLVPPFNLMSLKPGIGSQWFYQYQSDVFPHDYVVHDGVKHKPPSYYMKLLKRQDELAADDVKQSRIVRGDKVKTDNTDERLVVKERVHNGRNKFFKTRKGDL